jgi:hypothetical protein
VPQPEPVQLGPVKPVLSDPVLTDLNLSNLILSNLILSNLILSCTYLVSPGIFSWSGGAMGSGPVKGFNSPEVQQIVTRKHDPTMNKIAKVGNPSLGRLGESSHPDAMADALSP